MTAFNRLWAVVGLIILSAAYGVLVKKDPSLASAASGGYVAFLLTVMLILNIWKKP